MGEFKAQDIFGNEITENIFMDYDLTLVNIFTTWCSPCVAEIPHLAEIDSEMEGKGVNVVGIVMDVNDKGSINEEKLAKANAIAKKTGAEFEFIIPDDALRKSRLKGISAYPETFFVDSKGNIIGDAYVGARSKEEWIKIIEKELKSIKE
ncbi:TlpA disulfide reductase family protein [Oceanirhabdus seepicola]|uniref:TlpA family protein disulfide reductase n=1 Tax=Oceanirhabdus seepicola TaxID=2828781 RepID=UPI0030B8B82D